MGKGVLGMSLFIKHLGTQGSLVRTILDIRVGNSYLCGCLVTLPLVHYQLLLWKLACTLLFTVLWMTNLNATLQSHQQSPCVKYAPACSECGPFKALMSQLSWLAANWPRYISSGSGTATAACRCQEQQDKLGDEFGRWHDVGPRFWDWTNNKWYGIPFHATPPLVVIWGTHADASCIAEGL